MTTQSSLCVLGEVLSNFVAELCSLDECTLVLETNRTAAQQLAATHHTAASIEHPGLGPTTPPISLAATVITGAGGLVVHGGCIHSSG